MIQSTDSYNHARWLSPSALHGVTRRIAAYCGRILALVGLGLPNLFGAAAAADRLTAIDLPSGFELQTLQYPAEGGHLLIWLPSKYGLRAGHPDFAANVQRQDIEVWLVDLHESYLAPTSRYAYEEFRPLHVKELVDHAIAQGWQSITLGGESRGAALAMRAARQWQIENPGGTALKGLLFYHPHLIEGYTEIGEAAEFQAIARSTNLPVYIFQPQHSTKYLHSQELIEQLEMGGAAVYFHYLQGVRGGFHIRPVIRLHPREAEERARLGARIKQAIERLARLPTPERAAVPAVDAAPPPAAEASTRATLSPMRRRLTLPLRLPDGQGRLLDIRDHEGEVILVNFWASWCGPCVKEIASLMRLVESFDGTPFRVLAVNVGETRAHVEAFFDRVEIRPNFDVLFDPDGETAKTWKVYAVPSTYLVDKEQNIRYGYRGALRWDKSSVVEIVQGLLD